MRVLVLASALLGLAAGPAQAHQSSVKYVDLTVDGTSVAVAFTIAPGDVTEPLGMADDAQPSVAQAAVPAAAGHVRGWLGLATGDATCVPGAASARPDADGKFVVVAWTASCPGSIDQLRVDLRPFFQLDGRHEAIVTVHAPGKHGEPAIIRASQPVVDLRAGAAASFAAWIGYGMDHIYGGPDHVCFVLALLLVVVLARGTAGWELAAPLAALKATAAIVTAFTVAHSVSLIAASLGWIRLPSQLVESVIALSIAYTAIENVVRPDVRWRFGLTIAFGLVHGLGFASMLEELLPPTDVIVPLLGFNLGVELGQLTIVAVALPVCWGVAWLAGAERYRRIALPVAAVPLVLVGIKWLIERVFEVSTFTIWGM